MARHPAANGGAAVKAVSDLLDWKVSARSENEYADARVDPLLFVRRTQGGLVLVTAWLEENLTKCAMVYAGRYYVRYYAPVVVTNRSAALLVRRFLEEVITARPGEVQP